MRGGIVIDVCGRLLRARGGRSLLDALAALAPGAVGRGDYCRSGECAHCEVWLASDGGERDALSCQVRPADGMRVTRLGAHLEADLRCGR